MRIPAKEKQASHNLHPQILQAYSQHFSHWIQRLIILPLESIAIIKVMGPFYFSPVLLD